MTPVLRALDVRELDQAHIEQHLAVPVDQFANGGVEGVHRIPGRANGDGARRGLQHRLLHIEDLLGQVAHLGHLVRFRPER